jgi:hypothetical protein
MANEKVSILVDIGVKGREHLKGATEDLTRLGKSGGGLSSAAAGFKSMALAAGVAGVAVGAAAMAAKKAWDIMGEGAALVRTEARFNKLSESIGTTANMLTAKLRAATHGTISDMKLMADASQLISLRLADNADQVVRLGAVAGTLNWDMQQVILTFANMSTMRLDALGLSVTDVTSKARELELQGMSSQEAFKEAVILAGEAQKALLDVGNDAVRQMDQAQAGFTNAMDSMKMGAANLAQKSGFTGFMSAVGGAMTEISIGPEAYQLKQLADVMAATNAAIAEGKATNEGYLHLLGKLSETSFLFSDSQALVREEITRVTAAMEEQAKAAALVAAGGRSFVDLYTEWATAMGKIEGEQAENFLKSFNSAIDSMTSTNIDFGPLFDLTRQFEDGSTAAGEMEVSVYAANTALYEAAAAAGASAAELALLGVATGQFTEAEADAALKSAILQETINRLASDYAEGTISVYEMTDALRDQINIVAGMPSMFDAASRSVAAYRTTGRKGEEVYHAAATSQLPAREEVEETAKAVRGYSSALSEAEQMEKSLMAAHARMADAFATEINYVAPVDDPKTKKNEGGEDMSLILESGLVNVTAMNKALYKQFEVAGATAAQMAVLGVATGQFTEEQAKAALKAAILHEKIKMLAAQAVKTGDIAGVLSSVTAFQQQLDTGQIVGAADSIEGLAGAADAFAGEYAAELSVEDRAAMQAINDVQSALNSLVSGSYVATLSVNTVSAGGSVGGATAGPEITPNNTPTGRSIRDLASGASGGSSYNINIANYIDGKAQSRSHVDDVTTDKLMSALKGFGVRS